MNKNNFVIREAKEMDVPEMLELIRKHERDDGKYAGRYYEKYFSCDKITKKDTVFVAENDGEIVGMVGYCNDYLTTDYSYWIGWLVVAEEFRGVDDGFVARELLCKIESELKAYEVNRLFVSTEDGNSQAMSFYIKHGFKFEARLRDYYYEGEDQIILSKRLDA